jgi:hypothetical protein
MTTLSHHGEWLSLIDVSGPFLTESVLKEAFPQGLEGLESEKRRTVRQAYDEWREALDLDDADLLKIHRAWIDLVLKQALELDEDGRGEVLKPATSLDGLRYDLPEHGVTLRPDYAVTNNRADARALMLVSIYEPGTSLTEAWKLDAWPASPAERMVELCRATGVRMGLLTNGEQWMLVDAPVGAVTTFASWYARLWAQEPITLQAFVNLLGIRRFFVDPSEQLPMLLDESLKHQEEVTDALGEQVRRAVEVLIQALDRADVDRNRELLDGVEPAELYEAGLTVMMRIVFLLSAEERGLLLLGDGRYNDNYAVSTLRVQLRVESEEILERRWDAWSRLLSIFRAVYDGIDHESMRLPALGGSLFDPDRFPFLEGRKKGSQWRIDPAVPLPIDNRTVLYLLDAVQLFEGRTISYLALDIEQIGYVYEGLLERTVVRAEEVILDLAATKNAKNPWVSLPELEDTISKGRAAVEALLEERTGSSRSRVRNDLNRVVDEQSGDKLLTACHADRSLRDRLKPFFHFLRTDRWGYPLVYPKEAFMVIGGPDRRETGTHYTPKSFTEVIVENTLEPLVYSGPSEGMERGEWRLRGPEDLLNLKICDPAMGSGAFLVQVCRWLSERLVESWSQAEREGLFVTSEGELTTEAGGREPLHKDIDERLLTAKRLIAERCLYGVDMNPLAVELAKLSIWLVTLARGRPFAFLDHNLRCGDSLLGINNVEQIEYLDMRPGHGSTKKLFAAKIDSAVSEAIALRSDLRRQPIRDIRDVQTMARLNEEARLKLAMADLVADVLIGEAIDAGGRSLDLTAVSIDIGDALAGDSRKLDDLSRHFRTQLDKDAPAAKRAIRPFHWPLEFPEVFCRQNGGFDAFVGNPPFLGSQRITGAFGSRYKDYLAHNVTIDETATADLVVFFFLRVFGLVKNGGFFGLLARRSIAEGKNREIGLERILSQGATIFASRTNMPWPGKASVIVHQIHIVKSKWAGRVRLNGSAVASINTYLDDTELTAPRRLKENLGRMFQGTILNGEGFKIADQSAQSLPVEDGTYSDVIFPFIGGNEINSDPLLQPACHVVSFWDWSEEKAASYPKAFAHVEQHVKPERTRKKSNGTYQLRKPLPQRWWQHGEKRPALYHAIGRGHLFEKHPKGWNPQQRRLERVLAISRGVTKYPAFTFLPNEFVFSEKLYVIAEERYSIFSILSSDIHAVWAWTHKTSMGGDLYSLSYTSGEIFETFPFPDDVLAQGDDELERLGTDFYSARQKYMESTDAGLTGLYNEFHDPALNSAAHTELRDYQRKINEAVCRGYGWDDIGLACGFHAVGYLPSGSNVRFTIGEGARLEIVRRLSGLNKTRFEREAEIATQKAKSGSTAAETAERHDLFSKRTNA